MNNIFPIIDLFNQFDEQISDLQHRLKVAEIAVESVIEIANIKSNHFWTTKELKEKAEKELKGEKSEKSTK